MGAWLVLLLVILLVGSFRLRRLRHGSPLPFCAGCQYSLAGLPAESVCPECNCPARVIPKARYRLVPRVRRARLLQTLGMFIIVPTLWAALAVTHTALTYPSDPWRSVVWQSVWFALKHDYLTWRFFGEMAPSCAWMATAVALWPFRYRWVFWSALLVCSALVGESHVSGVMWWGRPSDGYRAEFPARMFFLIAMGVLTAHVLVAAFSRMRRAFYGRSSVASAPPLPAPRDGDPR